ncbi:MAG: DUF3592 domain-containing protein [Oscillospiraceae bacterium]|nr:DUF3592 domain-containing protein [Oscillospiraceae bacterium]
MVKGRFGGKKIIGLLLVIGFGAVLIFFGGNYIKKAKRCVREVRAEVVEMRECRAGGDVTYQPFYSYTFNGQTYEVSGSGSSNMETYHAGQHVTLHINPDDPTEFTDKKRDKRLGLFAGTIFLAFIGFGVYMLVSKEA